MSTPIELDLCPNGGGGLLKALPLRFFRLPQNEGATISVYKMYISEFWYR